MDWTAPRATLWGRKPLSWSVTKTFQHTYEHGDTLLRMGLWGARRSAHSAADAARRASVKTQANDPGLRPDLLLLVGPKGSGKSFIGEILERELGLPYVRPEAVVLRLRSAGRTPTVAESLAAIVAATEELAKVAPALTLDTTGAFDELDAYLEALARVGRVRLIQVLACPETCLARIRARDQAAHIPVEEEQIAHINARSLALRLPYELSLDNDPFAPPAAVVAAVRALLAKPD